MATATGQSIRRLTLERKGQLTSRDEGCHLQNGREEVGKRVDDDRSRKRETEEKKKG
ncbi:hypothetical protein L195_g001207 [Trifolium pratense]|uniref:Uncharacterized protein n=1 Tax=Trifolium pratense TaxID=57577 RepID=A0A2K3NP31_TRIPR|nr:hypothetical protein L195_g001207 [Trifolium pratense]